MDYNCELHQRVAAEDGVVGVIDVNHIEGYCFCSLISPFVECDVELYLAEGFDSLSSEANEWVLRILQSLLCEPHLDEALPYQNVCGAAIVDQNSSYIIPSEMYRILANVGSNDKGVIVRVVLQLWQNQFELYQF